MQYEFSIGSFFVGLIILAVGIAFVKWYQTIADNFGGGAGDYERYKLWALITCGAGMVIMTNLHVVTLTWLFGTLFNR